MSKPNQNDPLGLAAKTPGPTGQTGTPGPVGVAGIDIVPVESKPTEPKPKAFIVLIRHVTKGTLHVLSRGDGGVIVEFEDMEQAVNTASTVPACQRNPHFIAAIYE